MPDIFELADKLKKLKEQKKEHDDAAKEIEAQIKAVDQQMVQIMVDKEMQNFNRAGTLFYLNTKTYASPVPEKKPELFTTLKDEGFGDLVKETVDSRSLSAFVNEQIEQNGDKLPNWLEGLVNTFDKTTIGMRKAGK